MLKDKINQFLNIKSDILFKELLWIVLKRYEIDGLSSKKIIMKRIINSEVYLCLVNAYVILLIHIKQIM